MRAQDLSHDQKHTNIHLKAPREECEVTRIRAGETETPKIAKWTRGGKNERHAETPDSNERDMLQKTVPKMCLSTLYTSWVDRFKAASKTLCLIILHF